MVIPVSPSPNCRSAALSVSRIAPMPDSIRATARARSAVVSMRYRGQNGQAVGASSIDSSSVSRSSSEIDAPAISIDVA